MKLMVWGFEERVHVENPQGETTLRRKVLEKTKNNNRPILVVTYEKKNSNSSYTLNIF